MNELKYDHFIITGGAGAIGSTLAHRILENKDVKQVSIIDNFTSGYRWLIPEDERVRLIEEDIAKLPMDIDCKNACIFHLAAFFANQNSVDHPEDDLHTNGLGTLHTLNWAAKGGATRVVYASAGCSIAGHDVDGPIKEDMPVSLHLDTPYQITKALGEFYCNYYNPQVSTVRCRFFNSFGPGEVPGTYRNVIPNFIWLAMHNKPLVITGTGNETRDFIYVDDLVQGLMRCARIEHAAGDAFNIGTGRQTKIGDLAQQIIKLCDSKSELKYTERRPWDNSIRREANISHISSSLEFKPEFELNEGLERTVAWFRDNYDQIAESMEKEL